MPGHPLVTRFLQNHHVRSSDDVLTLIRSVAEIPWGEGRTIEEVLETKLVGTCTGKHLVLRECLKVLNVPLEEVVCTFRWSEQSVAYPPALRAILEEGPWEHGHNFLKMNLHGTWIDTDITWDSPLANLGFRTLPKSWNGTENFLGIEHIVQRWDCTSMEQKKKELIESLTPEEQERRRRFLLAFIEWINHVHRTSSPHLTPSSPTSSRRMHL